VVLAGCILGGLAGAYIQFLWLTSPSEVRQWGVPQPGAFSLPGAWHALFFIGVCAAVSGSVAKILSSPSRYGMRDTYVAYAASVSALAFAATVVFDSTRGSASSSSAATAAATIVATLAGVSVITLKVSGFSVQNGVGILAVAVAGLSLGHVLIDFHQSGSEAYLIAHMLGFAGGYGVGLAHWRAKDHPPSSHLPPAALPIALGIIGLALPSLIANVIAAVLNVAPREIPFEGVQAFAIVGLAATLGIISRRNVTGERGSHRLAIDTGFLSSLAVAGALVSFELKSVATASTVMVLLSATVLLAAMTITPDFRRYARWEAEVSDQTDSPVSDHVFQRAVTAGRSCNIVGTALRGLSALLVFLISLTALSAEQQTQVPSAANWTEATTLAAALLAALSVTLVALPYVMPNSRFACYLALMLPIILAPVLTWLALPTLLALPSLAKAFMVIAFVQGLCLAVDAAQSWVGTGRWLRGERFGGRGDRASASILAVGWVILIPFEFALVYAGGSSLLVLVLVFGVLGAVRFPLALAAGNLAKMRGGRDMASMDTRLAFVYDELFRWAIALLAIGAPAVILRVLESFQLRADDTSSVVNLLGPVFLAGTPIALLAFALPEFCRTNYFYAKTQAAIVLRRDGREARDPAFTGTFNFSIGFWRSWKKANQRDLVLSERFAYGLLAHIATQNVFRSLAVLLQPLALIGLGLEMLVGYFASIYRLPALAAGPSTSDR